MSSNRDVDVAANATAVALIVFVALTCGVLIVAVKAAGKQDRLPEPVSGIGSPRESWRLTTEVHDGHLWVMPLRPDATLFAPVHHPDCDCGRAEAGVAK